MFCKQCGKELNEGVAFCSNCGATVNTDIEKNDDMVNAMEKVSQEESVIQSAVEKNVE